MVLVQDRSQGRQIGSQGCRHLKASLELRDLLQNPVQDLWQEASKVPPKVVDDIAGRERAMREGACREGGGNERRGLQGGREVDSERGGQVEALVVPR